MGRMERDEFGVCGYREGFDVVRVNWVVGRQ